MDKDELREKLEDSDGSTVFEIWDRYCQQELPDKDDMIDDIMNFADSDEIAFDDIQESIESEDEL